MELDEELRTFAAHKAELLAQHRGEVALVKGVEVIGTFPDEESAYEEGLKRFGNVPFLVQPITEENSIETLPALTEGLLHARL
ncbi:MAG: hypothetical protein E6J80_06085 [Deltaproteobacteria bacterium]|nr:MAG: hypothetical protein E6J80_06085 [Deltaproteobacteria bacterium]